ncbi:MAG: hypothetical protein KI790_18190 [Cyclobacteriaceae bacterium]|nr:hypothetical protein [Cyclobacteriaceae bacterium HetDA_MAG_MS6]
MKKLIYYTFMMISFVAFTGCGGGKSGSAEKETPKEDLATFVEREFEYPIPTSYEVTNMLQKANANFVVNITNSPENVDNYVTEWQKAMNLGVFGADLSYASTYNKQEQTVDFLNASKTLIEDLNISTAFNASTAGRIEANLENKDSLILIVTESFYNTYNYLNQNGAEKTSLLVIAGSVIEGLYITSQLIVASEYSDALMEVMARQKGQVQKLVQLMEKHGTDENVNRVLPTLRYINLFYDQIGDDGKITKGQFDDVSKSITEMRSTIVG